MAEDNFNKNDRDDDVSRLLAEYSKTMTALFEHDEGIHLIKEAIKKKEPVFACHDMVERILKKKA